MKAKNKFLSGIQEFKSLDLFKGDEWVFPSSGVRLMDYKNKGLSVVFHKGNTGVITAELSSGEAFHLPSNYVPVGNCTFNGIIYIASVNNFGLCQIGCYPSPKWDSQNGGFVKKYQVLKNYYNNGRSNLITNKFNFSTDKQVDIVIKEIYDGSVNLYLADFNNPNRVINSGFDKRGFILEKLIYPDDFNGSNNLIPSTSKHIYPTLNSIEEGGKLEFGMYHIYFRYKTSLGITTSFIGRILPIQIFNGNNFKSVSGSYELSYDDNITLSNKKMLLDFSNVDFDTGYKYLEIAVVRYSSDVSNSLVREVYLIDKNYEILNMSNVLTIDGRESRVSFSFDEILIVNNPYTSSKSQSIVGSRYYAAHLKKAYYNIKVVSNYLSKIKIGYSLSNEIPDIPKYNSSNENLYQHQNPQITYSNTGFFRGETYPFAAKLIMNDGSTTEPFPLEGCYESVPGVRDSINTKGIYTFPSHNSAAANNDVNNRNKALGVKFDLTEANLYFNNNKEYFNNVIGIVFLRGDRIENLLYQGITSDVIKGISSALPLRSNHEDYALSFGNKRVIWPWESMGFLTGGGDVNAIGDHGRYYEEYNVITEEMSCSVIKDNKLKGMFAPDYLFEENSKINIDSNLHVKKILKFSAPDRSGDSIHKFPNSTRHIINTMYREYGHKESLEETITFYDDNLYDCNVNVIDDAITNGYNGMVSLVGHYNRDTKLFKKDLAYFNTDYQDPSLSCSIDHPERCTSREAMSHSIRLARHLAFKFESDVLDSWNNVISNVYKNVPGISLFNSIVNSFNNSSEIYYEISKIYKIDNLPINEVISFQGDCFLQRVAFRIFNTYETIDGWKIGGDYAIPRNHFDSDYKTTAYVSAASAVSAIFECRINASMRNKVESISSGNKIFYNYYPMIKFDNISMKSWLLEYTNENYKYEAFYVNSGYNKINSDVRFVGANNNINTKDITRPTRITFSPKSNNGELVDSFRDISAIAYQDFPLENGHIINIVNVNDTLVSIQESSINQHFLGEQKMSNSSSDIILKNSGIYLSDKVKQLANYGSQHQWSIISIGEHVFGVDVNKRIIWMIGSGETTQGVTSYNCTDLTKTKKIFGWIKQYFDNFSSDTNIMDIIKDNPINGEGINIGYNRRYNELNFIFHFKDVIENDFPIDKIKLWNTNDYFSLNKGELCKTYVNLNEVIIWMWLGSIPSVINQVPAYGSRSWIRVGDENGNLTILDEEDLNRAKIGDIVNKYDGELGYAYVSPVNYPTSFHEMYIKKFNGEDDPIIVNRVPITRTITLTKESLVYDLNNHVFTGNGLHYSGMYFNLGENMFSINEYNINNDKRNLVFLHDNNDSSVGNYYGEHRDSQISFIVSGAENTRGLIKLFTNYSINTDSMPFKKIEFFTDYQSSSIDPFIPTDPNMFYIAPVFNENMWRGPIKSNDQEQDFYKTFSQMKGIYLKVTLTYDGLEEKNIREFITEHIISYI